MMSIPRIIAAAAGQPWAMEHGKLQRIAAVLAARARGETSPGLTSDEVAAAEARRDRAETLRQARTGQSIAVLPMYGVITHRAGLMTEYSGGVSTEAFVAELQQAVDDPSVGAIVLDVDSPGGSVSGVIEAADAVYAARGRKPILAIANTQAASAAYWIAAQASELYVTPSGTVGSVGVYMLHEDDSGLLAQAGIKMTFVHAAAHKVDGNPYEPLSDDAKRDMQAWVDDCYAKFAAAVARGRGTTADVVLATYGDGRLVRPEEARAAGLVDGILTLDELLARAAVSAESPRRRSAQGAIDLARRRAALASV